MLQIAVFYSLLGLGASNVGLRGIKPFSMESIAFNSPDRPAAGSECPILLLTCHSGRLVDGISTSCETLVGLKTHRSNNQRMFR